MTERRAHPAISQVYVSSQRACFAGVTVKDVLDAAHSAYIVGMLEKHSGNVCAASRDMRLHRNTLSRQCKTLDRKSVV